MLTNRIQNPFLRGVVEWSLTLLLAVVLFFVLRTFIFRTATVTGISMEPTISHGDMLIINRLSYQFTAPRAGDIVAFPYRGNPSEIYIKRVIGVPGDIIELVGGWFWVNGVPLYDLMDEYVIAAGDVAFPVIVEDGHFFVLGDNRNRSRDSRFQSVGNVPQGDMIGRTLVRVWPNFGRVQ